MPRKLAEATREAIIKERSERLVMDQIASKVGCSRASIGRILSVEGMSRIKWYEPTPPIVRYERERSGELLHLDIKRLAKIVKPGHRMPGIRTSSRGAGYECLHVAIDDFSRVTFSEILSDQSAMTAAGFLRRAVAWYASQGITIERVLSDNGGCYKSRDFLKTCAELSITPKRTRPYRPQTNGKAERMIQTLIREWAYRHSYPSSFERTSALPGYLHRYNFHRRHSAIGHVAPMSRTLNNVLGNDN
jgi:transposase InsO family protein